MSSRSRLVAATIARTLRPRPSACARSSTGGVARLREHATLAWSHWPAHTGLNQRLNAFPQASRALSGDYPDYRVCRKERRLGDGIVRGPSCFLLVAADHHEPDGRV